MTSILITGASGFVGGYLSEYLLSQNQYKISGTYLEENSYQASPVKEKIAFHKIDLANADAVSNLLKETNPNVLIHLAAASSPKDSFSDPADTFHTNVTSQINLLEALHKNNIHPSKILIISSCEVYGIVKPSDLPVNENAPLRPASPYAVSKITQDFLGLQYFLTYNMPCVRIRPFNHIGPRQSPRFVVSDFSRQIALIEKGQKDPVIHVGNLEAKRDFTDVRDIARAYSLLIEKGMPGEIYNVGSGRSYSAGEILHKLLSISTSKITIQQDPAKTRPADMPDIICNNQKLASLTNWHPEIPLGQTLQDTLDYWRSIV